VACALANAAIRQGHTALYVRTPRLLDDLALGRADGRYARTLAQLARVDVLVLTITYSPRPRSKPVGTSWRS
jgi:DNA replication protein DnaC